MDTMNVSNLYNGSSAVGESPGKNIKESNGEEFKNILESKELNKSETDRDDSDIKEDEDLDGELVVGLLNVPFNKKIDETRLDYRLETSQTTENEMKSDKIDVIDLDSSKSAINELVNDEILLENEGNIEEVLGYKLGFRDSLEDSSDSKNSELSDVELSTDIILDDEGDSLRGDKLSMESEGFTTNVEEPKKEKIVEKIDIDIDRVTGEMTQAIKSSNIKTRVDKNIDLDSLDKGDTLIVKNEIDPNMTFREIESIDKPISSGIDIYRFQKENMEVVSSSIIKLVESTKDGNRNTMKVKLYPEELGDIDILLSLDDSKLEIRLLVQDEAIKNMFKDNMDKLNHNLLKENVNIQEFSVDVNRDFSSGPSKDQAGKDRERKPVELIQREETSSIKAKPSIDSSGISILA